MFFPESRVRVYLYGQAVDMRKSFDGLYAVARAAFPQDATGGDLYVFVSRSGRQIKVLYFDRSGWCVWAKRLEAGRFIADWSKARTHEIDCTGLKMLLEGIEPRRHLKRYRHDPHPVQRDTVPRDQGNSDHHRGALFGACVA
jgi:transposase